MLQNQRPRTVGDFIVNLHAAIHRPGVHDERIGPGLRDRVIYRELFPKGLTLLDVEAIGGIGISHITARQELREMISGLSLPVKEDQQQELVFA